jgi:hypothetical protein
LYSPKWKKSQRKTFCGHGRGKGKNDGNMRRHHSARFSGLLRKVENTFRLVQCIKLKEIQFVTPKNKYTIYYKIPVSFQFPYVYCFGF